MDGQKIDKMLLIGAVIEDCIREDCRLQLTLSFNSWLIVYLIFGSSAVGTGFKAYSDLYSEANFQANIYAHCNGFKDIVFIFRVKNSTRYWEPKNMNKSIL